MSLDGIALWIRIYDHTIATALINSIVSLGLYISLRAGLFNLSVVAFQALGAYTAGILALRLNLPTPLGVAAGVVLSLLIGTVLVFPILRLKGHYLAIATLSFGAIVQALALNLDDLTNGPAGLIGVPKTVTIWHLLVVLIAALAAIAAAAVVFTLGFTLLGGSGNQVKQRIKRVALEREKMRAE